MPGGSFQLTENVKQFYPRSTTPGATEMVVNLEVSLPPVGMKMIFKEALHWRFVIDSLCRLQNVRDAVGMVAGLQSLTVYGTRSTQSRFLSICLECLQAWRQWHSGLDGTTAATRRAARACTFAREWRSRMRSNWTTATAMLRPRRGLNWLPRCCR